MKHSPIISQDSQIMQQHDVEYIVLPNAEETRTKYFWDYIHIIRNRKWLALTPFLMVIPLVAIYLVITKPIYKATSTLLIEQVNPNVISIEEVVSPEQSSDSPVFFRTQYELIRSPLVLERVVDAFEITELMGVERPPISREIHTVKRYLRQFLSTIRSKYTFLSGVIPGEKTLSDEEQRQKSVKKLRNRLEVQPKSGTQLVDIVLKGPDSKLIIEQVNMIAEEYMKQNLDKKMDASTKAVAWLKQREVELKKKINTLETELQRYKENKKIVYLDQFQGAENPTLRRINSFQLPVVNIIQEKEKLRNEIKSIAEFSKSDIKNMLGVLPDTLNSPSINSLKTRYVELSKESYDLSKIYGKKHPEILRINTRLEELDGLFHNEIDKQIQSMQKDYRKLELLEQAFEKRLDEERKSFIQLSSDIQTYNDLKGELEIDKELLLTVSKRLAETTLTGVLETNNVRPVKFASVSVLAQPYIKMGVTVASLVLSLSLGVGLAIVVEHFDKRFRSVEEAEQYLGVAFLGMVPSYKVKRNKLVALYNPGASASEAYRTLRTWIRLSSQNKTKTLLITSALAGEGKSQTAGNLAISFAQLGHKVLLIDADLRRPQVHRTFNLPNSEGLVDVLAWDAEWPSVLQTAAMENLKVLPTGGRPYNPTELLSTPRMQRLLADVKKTFDLVIVDAPVTLSIPDVPILIPDMDGVLLVNDPSKGNRAVVLEAKKLLDRAGANLLGVIFNNVSFKKQVRYQHTSEYYQYSYNQLPPRRQREEPNASFIDMRPTES